jgi:hypothetical protein
MGDFTWYSSLELGSFTISQTLVTNDSKHKLQWICARLSQPKISVTVLYVDGEHLPYRERRHPPEV